MFIKAILQLGLVCFLSANKVGMRGPNGSGNGIESESVGLCRELQMLNQDGLVNVLCLKPIQIRARKTHLDLGSNVEESKVSGDEVVGDSSSFVL